ncbi:hypothetical protein QYF61_016724 [Mycteria americana]|uniref:Uncharacterized protein n=1 Tax=Mycteria americana TaxID=33587 RepID=A0AAN7RTF6_MYCAM|nr:hypothetical protein QYF61_016724 [Mycteria americana]
MRCLGTWCSGGLGSVRFTVGLSDPKGLSQPIRFCDSVILFLRRGNGEGGADLFSLVSCCRMRGNGAKLHQGRF